MEQKMATLAEVIPVYVGFLVFVDKPLVFCVLFCRSLFFPFFSSGH
jgi:hypothetical protein